MAGNIVTAAVGGQAGGVVLPAPEGPWHYTWPDVVAKTTQDIVDGYLASKGNPDGVDESDFPYGQGSTGAVRQLAQAVTSPTGSMLGILAIVAVLVVLFFVLRK